MIDKSQFNKTLDILALRVQSNKVQAILKGYRSAVWSFPRRKSVMDCPDEPKSYKLILFADEIPDDLLELGTKIYYQVHIGYDDYSFEEVIRKLIPLDIDPPASFESIGHIAHFNLRDDVMPFGKLIGEVLLDKHPQYRTVVTKVGSLEGPFRTFKMELLAGDDDFQATVKEEGLTLKVPFNKVYWNSRLSGERQRALKLLSARDRVVDMFCGVGAMSCLAAKKKCTVYSNDLNQDAVNAAEFNATANRVSIVTSCGDAREFVRGLVTSKVLNSDEDTVTHFIMNLPEIAIEFLDVFRDLLKSPVNMVDWRVYVHCFSRTGEGEIIQRVKEALKIDEDIPDMEIVEVRDVAPNKKMYCAQFKLPVSILGCSKKVRTH